MKPSLRRGFYWASPLPLISLLWVLTYLDRQEGWGAWAAAILVVIPMTLSFVLATLGGFLIYRERKAGGATVGLWWATLLAGSVDLWFVFRLLILEVKRSFY